MPEKTGDLIVTACDPEQFRQCDVVFSGFDAFVAGEVGPFVVHVWILIRLELTISYYRDPILRSQHPHLFKR